MQVRRIAKCAQLGFSIQQEYQGKYDETYKFLAKCRLQQNLKINIDQGQFDHLLGLFPEKYMIYSVRDNNGNLAACSVIIRVNEHVAYNFLPGFDRHYNELSPLAYLQNELYDILRQQNFTFFDLGISSIDGAVQKGLATFKERMGAIKTERYSYLLKFT